MKPEDERGGDGREEKKKHRNYSSEGRYCRKRRVVLSLMNRSECKDEGDEEMEAKNK